MRIAVTFTNPEPDTLVLDFGGGCRVEFDVRSGDFPVLDPQSPNTPCLVPPGDPVVLPGGGSWTVRHEWDGSQADGTPLPEGSYLLVAQLTEHVAVLRGKRVHKFPAGDTLRVQLLPPLAE
ncbi:MAG: hypothetical protein KY464_02100 [Gemmatimonadetes bacterium]|nr:hypothetical protein [Gemmatimonadota bacterium]